MTFLLERKLHLVVLLRLLFYACQPARAAWNNDQGFCYTCSDALSLAEYKSCSMANVTLEKPLSQNCYPNTPTDHIYCKTTFSADHQISYIDVTGYEKKDKGAYANRECKFTMEGAQPYADLGPYGNIQAVYNDFNGGRQVVLTCQGFLCNKAMLKTQWMIGENYKACVVMNCVAPNFCAANQDYECDVPPPTTTTLAPIVTMPKRSTEGDAPTSPTTTPTKGQTSKAANEMTEGMATHAGRTSTTKLAERATTSVVTTGAEAVVPVTFLIAVATFTLLV